MRETSRPFRSPGLVAAAAGAAFALAACTYVERTQPAPTVVTPPPQQPTVAAPAVPPTVTVRPGY
ncbi:hypothetical protein [Caldovatus aquaticus]|uniref:Uncharacterized protein n=1 Tax=Caldovatus aquaticus TaxID=2865671 RepID=A0ABS7F3U4_9PROT|nr:hypothetical protein [Caldovatus aquaticus]MBW8270279.1 hypothetical protein [Caldovatus aquaticus]